MFTSSPVPSSAAFFRSTPLPYAASLLFGPKAFSQIRLSGGTSRESEKKLIDVEEFRERKESNWILGNTFLIMCLSRLPTAVSFMRHGDVITLKMVGLLIHYLITVNSLLSLPVQLLDGLSSQWCFFNEDFSVMDP